MSSLIEPILVVPYDPLWPTQFAEERMRLQAAIGQHVTAIEHIGSTAVVGLAAKPVLDMLVGLRALDDAPATYDALRVLRYVYVPEFEDTLPERRYFRKATGSTRTHQIHMVEQGSPFWVRHLAFREYLRAHAEARDAYAALKYRLAAQYRNDRDAYTDAKTDFITGIERLARAERGAGE